ncbi:MAG TPA: FMN-binding protein [Pseudomonadales bacterium]
MAEPLIRPVLVFLALVIGCGVLIAATAALTRERIEENRAQRFLATLTELTGSAAAAADVHWNGDTALICPDRAVLRGRVRGYGGDIHWLAAADLDPDAPVLTRLRITEHQETPGIADFLDRPDRGWLASLRQRDAAAIAQVDAVSGATITSRALTRSLSAAFARPALTKPACPP